MMMIDDGNGSVEVSVTGVALTYRHWGMPTHRQDGSQKNGSILLVRLSKCGASFGNTDCCGLC